MIDPGKCLARSQGAAPVPATVAPPARMRGGAGPRAVAQPGMTLIELMIGLTISLLLALGLFVLIAEQSKTYQVQDNFGRMQENGTAALRYIGDSVRLAGFYGYARDPSDISLTTDSALTTTGDCGSTSNPPTSKWALQVTVPVYGTSALTPSTVNAAYPCIKSANFASGPGTNANPILVTRGSGGYRLTSATLSAQTNYSTSIYLQGAPGAGLLFYGGNFSSLKSANKTRKSNTGADIDIFEYRAHVYYVRPCSRAAASNGQCASSDDGGWPIPTLARQELVGSAMTEVPLVEGIERVSYLYGIDDRPTLTNTGKCGKDVQGHDGTTKDKDGQCNDGPKDDGHLVGTYAGTGVPTRFTATPSASDWGNVVAVKVAVLVRANTRTSGYDDSGKQYDLNGDGTINFTCTMTGATADACKYKRKVFSQMFLMRNAAQRNLPTTTCDSAKDHDCAKTSSDKGH